MRSIEAATDGNFFMAFTIYFTRSLKITISDYQKLVDALPKDSNPQAMVTLYDQLIAKGREEGLEKGREEGLEQGLEKGLEKGLEQGLEKGLEQGLEKGIEQGLEKGSELAKREAVLSGMRHSVPIQVICVMTGYSEEKVMQIIREFKDAES
ncbi:MAG: Essential protein Yae1, terminal [Bacteroidota bacterium]